MKRWELIANKMLNGNLEVEPMIKIRLLQMAMLIEKAGGELMSRQIIANVIVQVKSEQNEIMAKDNVDL